MSDMGCRAIEPRESSEQKPRIIVMALLVAVLSASSFMLLPNPLSGILPDHVFAGISYTSHGTISIVGNAQFNNTNFPNNGVVSGDGTASNPYIIEGWDISALSSDGINIKSTTAHFIIRNCHIYNGGLYRGILLETCSNGTVINNTCSSNCDGICLVSSRNNTLSNNTCSSNAFFGIYLFDSSNNTLSNNECSSNAYFGTYLNGGSNNTLNNNNCSLNDENGIYLYCSGNNTLNNNNCSLNDENGMCLFNSSGNILSKNSIYSNYDLGILLALSSSHNDVVNNSIRNNIGYGVNISSSDDNLLFNNAFWHNNGTTETYDPNNIQACDSGTGNRWNSSHGSGNFWCDWTTPDADRDEIVDNPYNISGGSGAKDYFPLALYDFDPPMTTVSLSGILGTNGWYKSPVNVSLVAADNVSGVNKTFYRIGTSGSWLNYSSPFLLSVEGNSTVQFCAIDNASNNESVKNATIKIDETPPTLTFIQSNNMTVTKNYVVISWMGSDTTSGVSRFEVKIDGGSYISVGSVTSHNFTALANGAHNVTVKAVDKAGHEYGKSIKFTVSISTDGGDPGSIFHQYGIPILALIIVIIVLIAVYHALTRKDKEHE